jgi:multiple sugar transport system substrate-binding protein
MGSITKRFFFLLLAAAISCAMLSPACAGEKTVITWWSFPIFIKTQPNEPAGTYEQSLIRAFEKQNPDVTVKFEQIDFTSGSDRIRMAIEDHSVCDVLFDAPGRIVDYGKKGLLVPLNGWFNAGYIADIRHKSLLGACSSGGKYYMYPLSTAPFYMAFNKKRLQDAGVLDLVREGWTDKDFLTVVRALKKKGYVPGSVFCAGEGGDQATRAFVCSLYGSSVTNRALTRYTINDVAGVKALGFIKRCLDEGTILPGAYYSGVDDINNFVNGLTSFTLLWSPNLQKNNEAALRENGIQTVEAPFPAASGKPSLEYLVNGFCVFNNGNPNRVEAAKRLIKFICDDPKWGPRNVIQTACAPVRKSFSNYDYGAEIKKVSAWTRYYEPYYNTVSGFSRMRTLWIRALQGVIFSDRTPKQAADEFVRQADKTIK